jgi:ActR/RegA family two-component response regulator
VQTSSADEISKRSANDVHSDDTIVLSSNMTLALAERTFIDNVLALCGGNKSEAARRLGIARWSLQRKLNKTCPRR